MCGTLGKQTEKAEGAHHDAQPPPLARYIQHASIAVNPDYDPEASRTMVPSGSVRMRPPTRAGCESSCVTQICALGRS